MAFEITGETLSWLLEGDPSIRWQVRRDLLHEPEPVYLAEQQRVALEGWGARLLSLQDEGHTWANGLYIPKWTSTTYTMLLLRRLGLPAANRQALQSCKLLLDKGFFKDGGINYFKSMPCSETCVSGMILSILAHFRYEDERILLLIEYLLRQQMADGGWNCELYRGATHASFHTTISVLEGLYEACGFLPDMSGRLEEAASAGREFLLRHALYRSERTGKIVDEKMTRLVFPPRWRFDFLRALDYFQMCHARRDERLTDAVRLLESKRRKDGRWILNAGYPGRTFFEMEKVSQPSRWNTLRALRVLQWWYA